MRVVWNDHLGVREDYVQVADVRMPRHALGVIAYDNIREVPIEWRHYPDDCLLWSHDGGLKKEQALRQYGLWFHNAALSVGFDPIPLITRHGALPLIQPHHVEDVRPFLFTHGINRPSRRYRILPSGKIRGYRGDTIYTTVWHGHPDTMRPTTTH